MRDYQRIFDVLDGKTVVYHGDYGEICSHYGFDRKTFHYHATSGDRIKWKYAIKEVGMYRKYYLSESKITGELKKETLEDLCDRLCTSREYIEKCKKLNRVLYGEWQIKGTEYREVLYKGMRV